MQRWSPVSTPVEFCSTGLGAGALQRFDHAQAHCERCIRAIDSHWSVSAHGGVVGVSVAGSVALGSVVTRGVLVMLLSREAVVGLISIVFVVRCKNYATPKARAKAGGAISLIRSV